MLRFAGEIKHKCSCVAFFVVIVVVVVVGNTGQNMSNLLKLTIGQSIVLGWYENKTLHHQSHVFYTNILSSKTCYMFQVF
jgi:hypothetical protein